MMKKITHTKEETAQRYRIALEAVCYVFNCSSCTPTIFGLVAREGHGTKSLLRFFMVHEGRIDDMTAKIADITGSPLYCCYTYFAIYTHRTNMQDVVAAVSEKIYGDTNTIRLERL